IFPIDYAVGIANGNFNEDGFVDFAVISRLISGQESTFEGRVNILLGAAGGVPSGPTAFPDGRNTGTLAVADFDGDGHLDLAIGHFQGAVSVLRGDGTGSFATLVDVGTSFLLQGADSRIRTADFNADGKPDLVVTCSGVCVLLNTTQISPSDSIP